MKNRFLKLMQSVFETLNKKSYKKHYLFYLHSEYIDCIKSVITLQCY